MCPPLRNISDRGKRDANMLTRSDLLKRQAWVRKNFSHLSAEEKTPAADRLQAGEEESAVFCQTDRVWLTRLYQNLC